MHYRQLTQGQRYMIYALGQEGYNHAQIGLRVGVHRSTISREVSRNVHQRGYRPAMAHRLAMARRYGQGKPWKFTPRVKNSVRHYLNQDWSPEQISGWLHRTGHRHISHQTIYNYVHQDRQDGGSLYLHLRRRRSCRCRPRGRNRPIRNRQWIEERPAVVDQRRRLGDWEVDTLVGKDRRHAVVSMVERFSRLTLLGKVMARNAQSTAQCMVRLMTPLKRKVHTITSDNGTEFAAHRLISRKLDAGFFFAHPYKPWQRGLVENTNGLVRQYLPKGTPLSQVTDGQLRDIAKKLNHRPRKALNFNSPVEVFYADVALAF